MLELFGKLGKWFIGVMAFLFVLGLIVGDKTPDVASVTSASASVSAEVVDDEEVYTRVMKGTIYETTTRNTEEFRAGVDIPVGTYLFIIKKLDGESTYAPGWISIQFQGDLGIGGGYVSWGIMPVRDGQTLLASRVKFCLLEECDESLVPDDIEVFKGKPPVSQAGGTGQANPGRYDGVTGAAETIKEQYPDISWSSQWEELSSMGYTDEEIAWAIGG